MTMQEAINHAKEVAEEKYKEGFLCYANSGDVENDKKNDECVKCAKEHEQLAEWLEELQQYRAIGTVKYFKECADILNKAVTDELAKIIDEWILYHKIGTVEECREARKRQRAKKRVLDSYCGFDSYECPACGTEPVGGSNYCHKCGQRLERYPMTYQTADQRHPFIGLDNKICKNPTYWCRLHQVWLSEEDVKRKKCRCKADFDLIGTHRCGNLERKD